MVIIVVLWWLSTPVTARSSVGTGHLLISSEKARRCPSLAYHPSAVKMERTLIIKRNAVNNHIKRDSRQPEDTPLFSRMSCEALQKAWRPNGLFPPNFLQSSLAIDSHTLAKTVSICRTFIGSAAISRLACSSHLSFLVLLDPLGTDCLSSSMASFKRLLLASALRQPGRVKRLL